MPQLDTVFTFTMYLVTWLALLWIMSKTTWKYIASGVNCQVMKKTAPLTMPW